MDAWLLCQAEGTISLNGGRDGNDLLGLACACLTRSFLDGSTSRQRAGERALPRPPRGPGPARRDSPQFIRALKRGRLSAEVARLTTEELARLLKDLESDRVERKASLADRDRIREAICAFSNDLPGHGSPGVIFVGAHDDGGCANLTITDDLLLKISNFRGEGTIQPLPSFRVEKRIVDECELVVVEVEPNSAPPVRFRGRTWVRLGPSGRIATLDEEKRLAERRRAADLPFDLQPIPSATIDDLELELFERTYLPAAVAPEILEGNRRSTEDQLRALRFVSSEGHPTMLGVVVLGSDPRAFVPGDYLQFVRFDGEDLGAPVKDQKEVDGPLPELLRRLDEILEINISTALDVVSGPTEVQHPDYPISALQQLTRNAVLHRTYESSNAPVRIYWFSDRIEIHSPGGPFGQVSVENFGRPGLTDYRNPHLAEAMKVLGYVQRFGVGLAIARSELERNDNPALELDAEPNFVLATVRRRR